MKRPIKKIFINDHTDILIEILTRLDAPSLATAACVCRLWHSVLTNDLLWEHLCFRNASFPSSPLHVRPIVEALGGYQRLYTVCVRPVLARLQARTHRAQLGQLGPRWSRIEVELSLSLFCMECYERMGGGSSSSLMFLCEPVNV